MFNRKCFGAAVCLVCCAICHRGWGQELLFGQSHSAGAASGRGNFLLANQLTTHPEIPDEGRSRVWDNFHLAQAVQLESLEWSGAFDGPFKPRSPRTTLQFQIEIFPDANEAPELSQPTVSWLLDSGRAGTDDGPDVRSRERDGETTSSGASVVDYRSSLSDTFRLEGGDYWLSITAVQTFPNPSPLEDPINGFWDPGWGWHFGDGDDGSFAFDGGRHDAEPGVRNARDLSFRLWGEVAEAVGAIGDFNGDGTVGAGDIDLLGEVWRAETHEPQFDLNADSRVDELDQLLLVEEIIGTRRGDSNLDLVVDFTDFLNLSRNFDSPGGWDAGDFDGTGDVGFGDFLELSRHFGVEADAIVAVPEPTGWRIMLMAGWLPMFARWRRSLE